MTARRPSDIRLLDDVLGLGGASEHAVGHTEERWPQAEERLEVAHVSPHVRGAKGATSHRSAKPWLLRPRPALNRDRRFSSATQAANSTISGSLRCRWSRSISSSEMAAGVAVAATAYSRTARSVSS
jgi:hypothetical protein